MALLGSASLDIKVLCEECNDKWNLVKKLSQEEIKNKIFNYLNTSVQLRECIIHVLYRQSLPSQSSFPLELPKSDELISCNAIAQKEKKELEKELAKLQAITRITTNPEYYKSFSFQVFNIQRNIKSQDDWLDKLKRHAASQRKSQ
ncbi:22130_t:CDS:1, partial [Dentiscutata erythropus]